MPGLLFVAITAATWAATSATCADDPSFKARNGLPCSAWSGVDCFTTHAGLSEQGLAEVLAKCGATCGTCIPARDYCDNGQGGDRVTPNMMDKSSFTFVEDDLLDTACDWRFTGNALEQTSNAYGNPEDNSLMGCMALLKNSNYNEFVMSVDIENFDDDGIGFVFGYKTKNDRYQVHMINDRWPDPAADSVPGPHLKMKMHNGKPASDHFDASNVPFDLLAYVANDKLRHDAHVYPDGKLASMKYIPIPYSTTYHNYGIETTLTLIVKDGQARAYFKAKDGATVGVWTDLPESYDGGEVGIFTYADEAVRFRNLRVTDIGAAAAPLSSRCEDPAKTCDSELGLCCDGPCVVPTPSPTVSPTVGYVENGHDVAASEVCPGAVGGTYLEPRMDLASFDLIDHPKLSEPCTWQNTNDGIKQTSNAWGNPGANSMMGCLALVNGHQYTDFMLEVDIESFDNDGVGIVFGYSDIDDHYVGIANNDIWPSPAADGVGGPFLKIKHANGKPVLDHMDALNTCWDTLTYVDSHGPDTTAMGNIPFEYERVYPYKVGTDFQPMRMTLIVKNNEARVVFKSPDTDTSMDVNSVRRGNKFAGAWTKSLPESYVGGMVGVMTFAHQAAFTNMKITDLSKPVGAFCNGEKDVVCDAGKSGLCLAVPIADVCPDPVGANVIDTSSATSFDFVDDSGLSEACQWDITKDGRLSQVTNSHGYVFTLLGCNAIAKGEPYTDFIAQVSIENHDNDAVGMIFNWESEDRHCKVHACNDIWPSPAADNVEGPAFKIKCRNGNSCEAHPLNSTNNCYDTVAFVDRYGVYHGAMADGAVTPPVYSDAYIPYGYYSPTKMILMVRGQQMRAIFTPASGDRVVAAFSFQLPFNYDGGRVGLFTSADQAVFSDFSIAPLSGPHAIKEFCDGTVVCEAHGLCGTRLVPIRHIDTPDSSSTSGISSNSKSSSSSTSVSQSTFIGSILGLISFALVLGAFGFLVGTKSSQFSARRRALSAILRHELEMTDSAEPAAVSQNPIRIPGGQAGTNYELLSEAHRP